MNLYPINNSVDVWADFLGLSDILKRTYPLFASNIEHGGDMTQYILDSSTDELFVLHEMLQNGFGVLSSKAQSRIIRLGYLLGGGNVTDREEMESLFEAQGITIPKGFDITRFSGLGWGKRFEKVA